MSGRSENKTYLHLCLLLYHPDLWVSPKIFVEVTTCRDRWKTETRKLLDTFELHLWYHKPNNLINIEETVVHLFCILPVFNSRLFCLVIIWCWFTHLLIFCKRPCFHIFCQLYRKQLMMVKNKYRLLSFFSENDQNNWFPYDRT